MMQVSNSMLLLALADGLTVDSGARPAPDCYTQLIDEKPIAGQQLPTLKG